MIKQVLEQEIEWCKNNRVETLNEEFQNGFIAGLKQSLFFIEEIRKLQEAEERLESMMCSKCGRSPAQFHKVDCTNVVRD